MRSSKVTFSSPSPKSILNSLNNSPPITAPAMPTGGSSSAQTLLLQSHNASRESARESADNDPYDDLADVHDLDATDLTETSIRAKIADFRTAWIIND